MSTSTQPRVKMIWERGQRGWPESSPLVQFPNPPLLVALGGFLVAALTDGSGHDYALATGYAALGAWSWLELMAGSGPPRRVLGAAGLVFVVVRTGQALGA
jgi:hypothetical protein